LALWGVSEPGALDWLDPPPSGAFNQARRLLTELGALDAQGVISAAGRAMAELPLHPRLAHMLQRGKALGLGALACDLAALLSERDILIARDNPRSCDLTDRVEALIAYRARGPAGARAHGADDAGSARCERASAQWRRVLGDLPTVAAVDPEEAGLLLSFAYPDRIAARRAPDGGRYLLANGRGARLAGPDRLSRREYLVAAHLDAGRSEGVIYLAVPVAPEALRRCLAQRVRIQEVIHWDAEQGQVSAQREERYGALLLGRRPLQNADSARVRQAILEGVRQMGVECLPWTRAARDWQARVLSLRHWFPAEGWPDVSDAYLAAHLEDWLAPALSGVTRREHLGRIDVQATLSALLDWNWRERLEQGAPTHVTVPSGSRLRLEYTPGEPPVLAVRLQEMFGLADTPRVAWGRVPVTLHLLSPARRPIQVTQDLRGFWERTYAEVKKELKGRYPKHAWPDDPWRAPPTARVRRGK
ncbi:MAG: ATP-dependent helicase HrpB, partial [Gammaproteobacteria bacterium]|nr:ATP-dependent helicase HrpB [Gammaproteobacteria bacterium]